MKSNIVCRCIQLPNKYLSKGRVDGSIIAPWDKGSVDTRIVRLRIIAEGSDGTHDSSSWKQNQFIILSDREEEMMA